MELHQEDLEWGYSGYFLFDLIERKYKNAARKLEWQWFFPAKTLIFVPDKDEYIVVSVPRLCINKPISAMYRYDLSFLHPLRSRLKATNSLFAP